MAIPIKCIGTGPGHVHHGQDARATSRVGATALDAAVTNVDSLKAKIALARGQVEASATRIEQAQQNVDDCVIRAPFRCKFKPDSARNVLRPRIALHSNTVNSCSYWQTFLSPCRRWGVERRDPSSASYLRTFSPGKR